MLLIKILFILSLSNNCLAFLFPSTRIIRTQSLYFQKKEILENNSQNKLSHYQEAQTIIRQHQGYGVLSTLSIKKKINGSPSTSIVSFASDEKGNPIFCLSNIASHTLNVKKNNLVSFSTTEHFFKNANDYRVSYTGKLNLINNTREINQFQKIFNESHPDAFYNNFDDFHFYRLESVLISFNGGFGMNYNLNLTTYFQTQPDLINIYSNDYIVRLNRDFNIPINIYFQRKYFNIKSVELKRIDKYGMDFRLYFEDNYVYTKTIKFPFKERSPEIFNLKLLHIILVEELDYLVNH